jgi:Zn-finger nucleic acid-binding protein
MVIVLSIVSPIVSLIVSYIVLPVVSHIVSLVATRVEDIEDVFCPLSSGFWLLDRGVGKLGGQMRLSQMSKSAG